MYHMKKKYCKNTSCYESTLKLDNPMLYPRIEKVVVNIVWVSFG
jgi:ribosomal protein L5